LIEFDHRYVKICRICKVVFNPQKPTTHDVDWNGQQWFFQSVPILEDMVEMDVHLFES